MSFSLILLAAGKSTRFKSHLSKLYHKIGGKTLLEINISKMLNFKQIKRIVIVYNRKDLQKLKKLKIKNAKLVLGGKTRQESAYLGLKYLAKFRNTSKVLIHDAARPNFSLKMINQIIINSKKYKTVIPIIKVRDAIKYKKKSDIKNLNRSNFFLTQTPQCFNKKEIFNLHKQKNRFYLDDDFSLIRNLKKVKLLPGEITNIKVTEKKDINFLKTFLKNTMSVGIGFDVHRLVKNKKLFLAGLNIPSKLGTDGHSDGDPVLHAIIDAILGACRLGDIGRKFSDKKNKFKNIRSTILLNKVLNEINKRNYFINNMDINIITQTPKIKKYKDKIINNISKLCKVDKKRLNVKGKTAEKLGVIGNENAIASEVILSMIKYD